MDHLEIHARNREVVRILFMLGACDREVIAWSAVANAGISGEMVRDLMVTAVERRFSTTKVRHAVEWLSDNGSAYIARDTTDTARALGLTLLFTPVRSPESKGMSEAFVETLRRDYARITILSRRLACCRFFGHRVRLASLSPRTPRGSDSPVSNAVAEGCRSARCSRTRLPWRYPSSCRPCGRSVRS